MVETFRGIKKMQKQSRLLIFSYASIIALVVLFNIGGYFTAYHIIQSEYESVRYSELEQAKLVYENNFTNVEFLADQIAVSTAVEALRRSAGADGAEVKPLVKDIINEIRGSFPNPQLGFYTDCFVVFRELDMCISSHGMDSFQSAYYSYFRQYYSAEEAWINDIFHSKPSEYKSFGGGETVFYLRTNARDNPTVAVLLPINMFQMKRLFQAGDGQHFAICNLPEDGTLYGNGNTDDRPRQLDVGVSEKRMNGDGYVFIASENQERTRRYVFYMPRSVFSQKLLWARVWFIGGNAVCILLCILMALRFTKNLYDPIFALVKRLGGREDFQSEFLFINKKLDEFVRERKLLREKNYEQSFFVEETILINVLLGEVRPGDAKWKMLESMSIAQNGELCVLVFDIVEVGLLKSPDDSERAQQNEFALATFSIVNVLMELSEEFASMSSCLLNGNLVCIFNFFSGRDSTVLKESVKKTHTFLKKNFNMSFVCGMSDSSSQIEELPALYEQALDIVGLHIFKDGDIILSAQESSGGIQMYKDLEEGNIKLMAALNAGDAAAADKALDELFICGQGLRNVSLSLLRMRYFDIVETVLRFLQKSPMETIEVRGLLNIQIQNTSQASECVDRLRRVVKEICQERQKNMSRLNDERCQKIIGYIQEHCNDPYLNVSVVAEEFGVSLSYISSYFKKQTGEGMANYIVLCRLKHAKELLLQSDKTVNQIAKEAGFYNTNIFIRAFKREENMTPGQFREVRGKSKWDTEKSNIEDNHAE